MTDKDIEKAAAGVAGNRNEKNFLQDQMKAQRDAPDTNSKMNEVEGLPD